MNDINIVIIFVVMLVVYIGILFLINKEPPPKEYIKARENNDKLNEEFRQNFPNLDRYLKTLDDGRETYCKPLTYRPTHQPGYYGHGLCKYSWGCDHEDICRLRYHKSQFKTNYEEFKKYDTKYSDFVTKHEFEKCINKLEGVRK